MKNKELLDEIFTYVKEHMILDMWVERHDNEARLCLDVLLVDPLTDRTEVVCSATTPL